MPDVAVADKVRNEREVYMVSHGITIKRPATRVRHVTVESGHLLTDVSVTRRFKV